ncbi:DUF4192 family protein [Cellulomonas sp. NPDC089187]|uniref:DUF4192 family protein n=1 Tax=Cellulomonas sp. NPDC089187 TaxID=3154970 RepID=UPI00341E9A99
MTETSSMSITGAAADVLPHIRELLAAVPIRLGHQPTPGSVVTIGIASVDADEPMLVASTSAELIGGEQGEAVGRSVVAHLVAMGCEWVALAGYPDASVPGVEVVRRLCFAAGIRDAGVRQVGAGQVVQKPQGVQFPTTALADTRIARRAAMDGRAPVRCRADLGCIPAVGHVDRRAAAEGRLRWSASRVAEFGHLPVDMPVWGEWQRRSLRRWRRALADPEAVTRSSLGRIEAGLDDHAVVEAAALTLIAPEAPEDDDVLARLTTAALDMPMGHPEGSDVIAVRPWLALLLTPGIAPPDPEPAHRAVRLLHRVVSHGRLSRQAGALTILALLAWCRGEGVLASVWAERARVMDPDQPLAAQLDWLLAAGAVPGWVRIAPA